MQRKKRKTIQKKLFHNYFGLILSVVLLFLLFQFFYIWNMMKENVSQSMMQMNFALQNELEMELDKANNLQKRIIFSEPFGKALFSEKEIYQDVAASLELHRELSGLTDAVCGPDDYRNYQMNYWNSNGGGAGVGYNSFIGWYPEKTDKVREFEQKSEDVISKVISAPYTTRWEARQVKVLSMFRMLRRTDTSDKVIVETQIAFQNLEKIIQENLEAADSYDVLIVNQDSEIIFISDTLKKDQKDIVKQCEKQKKNNGEITVGSKAKIYQKSYSKFLGWDIWIMESENKYKEPFRQIVFIILFAFGAIGVLLWKITYNLTKQMVTPLVGIHQKIKSLDLNKLEDMERQKTDSDVKELQELDGAFDEMCQQLKTSKEKLQTAQAKEMQSKFLAIQAQMDPHFLYNILSIIKIMGKEVKSNEIVEACTELSKMLRYISSSDQSAVTVAQEEEHTRNYMKLMKTRFRERLEYEINIQEEMKEVCIPRLILQPLTENSIKYATNGRAPWKIQVRGWIEEEKWYLSVRDNGPGMSEDVKSKIELDMKDSLNQKFSEKMEIGGMGIINIYSRLVLMYGEAECFQIENLPEGGLEVTIRGKV